MREQFALRAFAGMRQVLAEAGTPLQRIVEHQFTHIGAAALQHLQMAFVRELAHGLAQRVAIDAEAFGELGFVGQLRSGR